MNICKIVRITPDGAAWTNAHGTLYPFVVGFEDGHAGQVNAKTNPPAYVVGEVVGYEVTGKSPRGQDKFKITRNPDASKGTYTGKPEGEDMPGDPPSRPTTTQSRTVAPNPPQVQAPRQSSQNAQERLPVNLPHGATVGGALARAVDIWLKGPNAGEPWSTISIAEIEGITRDLVNIQGRIERGEP
jgi:hypothetical protein